MNLVHCIYTSAESTDFNEEDIFSLLEKSRSNNASLDVTGMLLYEKGSFFQVLEGPEDQVLPLFEKIAKDKRHQRVVKIIYEPIEARDFSDWTMGYAAIPSRELSKVAGLNDFFHSGKCYTDLDAGRAKQVLEAFKEGKWRSMIS